MAATIADLRIRALALRGTPPARADALRRPEPLPIRLDRRRIYVLPTGSGLAFALLLFVMLIGALNYANNPALLLTCLFAAACGASLFAGFRAMNGLCLLRSAPTNAMRARRWRCISRFAPSTRARPSLRLRHDESETAFRAAAARGRRRRADDRDRSKRGWLRPGRIRDFDRISARPFPHLELAQSRRRIPRLSRDRDSARRRCLRRMATRPSDTGRCRRRSRRTSRLSRHRSAASDRLESIRAPRHAARARRRAPQRRCARARLSPRCTALDTEARIRRLTAWVLAAESAHARLCLASSRRRDRPGLGGAQRHACLRALALLPMRERISQHSFELTAAGGRGDGRDARACTLPIWLWIALPPILALRVVTRRRGAGAVPVWLRIPAACLLLVVVADAIRHRVRPRARQRARLRTAGAEAARDRAPARCARRDRLRRLRADQRVACSCRRCGSRSPPRWSSSCCSPRWFRCSPRPVPTRASVARANCSSARSCSPAACRSPRPVSR